jgi:hypothetical protein
MDSKRLNAEINEYGNGTNWGSSRLTSGEAYAQLQELDRIIESGDPNPLKTLSARLQKGEVMLENPSSYDVVEAGAFAGCSVIPTILERKQSDQEELWHYWAKMRAYRLIAEILLLSGNARKIYDEWISPDHLERKAIPVVKTKRPIALPETMLYGREKLLTFYPTNLFRVIEAVWARKKDVSNPLTGEKFNLERIGDLYMDRKTKQIIVMKAAYESNSLLGFSTKIIANTYEALRSRGLKPAGLRAIFLTALNPSYHLLERGEIGKLRNMWAVLEPMLSSNDVQFRNESRQLFLKAIQDYNSASQEIKGRHLDREAF